MIGYLAAVYRENLLDPWDKPPNIVKSSFRLCEILIAYFKVFLQILWFQHFFKKIINKRAPMKMFKKLVLSREKKFI